MSERSPRPRWYMMILTMPMVPFLFLGHYFWKSVEWLVDSVLFQLWFALEEWRDWVLIVTKRNDDEN